MAVKLWALLSVLFYAPFAEACTVFGAITESGTIIGKNRDYYYNPQQFQLMMPIHQFHNWYDNPYHHDNQFYALTSNNEVSWGINQSGLTAIEEDTLPTKDAAQYRRMHQPENGMAEEMVLYGILQNFNSVDELIPFLTKIFSVAEPDFYQIADAKKIVTIEVAYGASNQDLKRKFTYRIISKKAEYFTHTNTYLSPEFISLNDLSSNQDSLNGAKNRLQKITALITQAATINIDVAAHWFFDTHSNLSSTHDKNWCQNTSIFRSNLQGMHSVDLSTGNDKIYGTVSSMIFSQDSDPQKSFLYLKMIDSITTLNNGSQLIKYKELRTNLASLFSTSKPFFVERQWVRSPPLNGTCS